MTPTPKVSIAIPVYRREDYIGRAIESALSQTYGDLEVVVVDNRSPDGTWDVVQGYARRDQRLRCWQNEENIGPQANWKRAIEHCRGEYVKLLFSDDWLEQRAIQWLLPPLEERADVAFTYSAFWMRGAQQTPSLSYGNQAEGAVPTFEYLWKFASLEDVPWRPHRGVTFFFDVPVSPIPALFRRRDAVTAVEVTIPTRLGLDFNRHAAGNDALISWRCCERYPYVYFVAEPLVNGCEPETGEPGLGWDLGRNNNYDIMNYGYSNAFAHFLATSSLPTRTKRVLHTAMVIGHLRWNPTRLPTELRILRHLFPATYPYWRFSVAEPRIWRLLAKGIRARASARLGWDRRQGDQR